MTRLIPSSRLGYPAEWEREARPWASIQQYAPRRFNWRWLLLVTVNALIWAMVLTAPRACG